MDEQELIERVNELSPRQKEILRLVGKHWVRKEIARQCKISPHTVRAHIDEARRRLGAQTDREAARILIGFESSRDGLPAIGEYPTKGIVDGGDEVDDPVHEHAAYAPTDVPDILDRRIENGTASPDLAGQVGSHRKLSSNNPDLLPQGRVSEGRLYHTGDPGLADRGWARISAQFIGRLKSLTPLQSIGLILLAAMGLALAGTMLTAFLAVMFQAIQTLTGQTR